MEMYDCRPETEGEKIFSGVSGPYNQLPLIGDEAPSFMGESTMGKIDFPKDYRGKWVILFSHPADFTPVCTSELATFAAMQEEFRELNTELLGVSVDSVSSHLAWIKTIQERIRYNKYQGQRFTYPVIADVKMEVARKYGMIQPHASDTKAVRAVFFIDPQAKIRAMIYYPMSNGRNFAEIKRLLVAMQTSDEHKIATPADWRPGDDVLVSAPVTLPDLDQREKDEKGTELRCDDWFFCRTHI